jgi:hypothetical protein
MMIEPVVCIGTSEPRPAPAAAPAAVRRPPCYSLPVTRPPEFDHEIEAVRQLLREVSDRLSQWRIAETDELLRNDEPNEAILGIAADLAPQRAELPEHVVRFIREAIANSRDLPAAFRE